LFSSGKPLFIKIGMAVRTSWPEESDEDEEEEDPTPSQPPTSILLDDHTRRFAIDDNSKRKRECEGQGRVVWHSKIKFYPYSR
jgi:hypothetical protein